MDQIDTYACHGRMQARIKAAGGRIVFTSGSHRVMGMLAMSRAIGDHFLRPYVIAEPEVSHVHGWAHCQSILRRGEALQSIQSRIASAGWVM